jgi:hypothetical protein
VKRPLLSEYRGQQRKEAGLPLSRHAGLSSIQLLRRVAVTALNTQVLGEFPLALHHGDSVDLYVVIDSELRTGIASPRR